MKIGDLVRARLGIPSRRMATDIVGIILKVEWRGSPTLNGWRSSENWAKVRWLGYRGGRTAWEPVEAVEVISESR